MDLAGLLVNIGVFIASAIAAWVAWEQARSSKRAKTAAEAAELRTITAREAAVEAQEAAADALKDANRIAREAKQIVEKSEARKLEEHLVRWQPKWNSEQGFWWLVSAGPDTARDVALSVTNDVYGHMDVVRAAEIAPGSPIGLEFPAYKGAGGFPKIEWTITWRTPLNSPQRDEGTWG